MGSEDLVCSENVNFLLCVNVSVPTHMHTSADQKITLGIILQVLSTLPYETRNWPNRLPWLSRGPGICPSPASSSGNLAGGRLVGIKFRSSVGGNQIQIFTIISQARYQLSHLSSSPSSTNQFSNVDCGIMVRWEYVSVGKHTKVFRNSKVSGKHFL